MASSRVLKTPDRFSRLRPYLPLRPSRPAAQYGELPGCHAQVRITPALRVQEWIAVAGAKTAYIERGSPWENGYIESFNARLRDELLDGEIFYSLREARIVIESWRRHYNTIRPHASLGYKPPAPE